MVDGVNFLEDAIVDDLDEPPCPVPEALLQPLVMAICDGGKRAPRCTWPDCIHGNAKKKAVAAWLVIMSDAEVSGQPVDEGLAATIERSIET